MFAVRLSKRGSKFEMWYECSTLEQASDAVRKYIVHQDLTMHNWGGGEVMEIGGERVHVATIAYNGTVEMTGKGRDK